jgi:2'-deoxynucleoside 5'-phosphate N-hydrolase
MKVYIAASYSKRKQMQDELNAVKEVLTKQFLTPFVFIDNYNFNSSQSKEMMETAFAEIDKSSLLIAEVSDKAIGIGVEIGYAKAKHKPVIYLRNVNAEHSTTVAGTSDHILIYNNTNDLETKLGDLLEKIIVAHSGK